MDENAIGKAVVDAAVHVFTYLKLKGLRLGYVLNFGGNLMKDGIERIVDGLPEESLGVLASWRETEIRVEPGGAANAAPPHR